jgi:UDPglucose 6-dehydrogenase
MHCTIAEASLAKYTINCFLSTKVIFMNELHNLTEKLGCDYKKISEMIKADKRIGNSHLQVPGPDGAFGFGGMCFPKDTSALLKYAADAGAEMMVLNAAVRKNTFLRLTEPK